MDGSFTTYSLLLMVQPSCTCWGWSFIPLFTGFDASQVVSRISFINSSKSEISPPWIDLIQTPSVDDPIPGSCSSATGPCFQDLVAECFGAFSWGALGGLTWMVDKWSWNIHIHPQKWNNIAPETWWLEDKPFVLGWPIFWGRNVSFRECKPFKISRHFRLHFWWK